MERELDELNMKAVGLEAEVGKLKVKVVKVKEVSTTKFKELDTYMLVLNTTVSQFLTKERLKIK